MAPRRIGELLVQAGVLTPSQLERALARQQVIPGHPKLGEVVLAMGFTTEETILEVIARALRLPAVDWSTTTPSTEALAWVSSREAEQLRLVPLRIETDGPRRRLVVAMADPTNLKAIDDLQFKCGMIVRTEVATARQILDTIRTAYQLAPKVSAPPSMPGAAASRQDTWGGSSQAPDVEPGEVAELRFVKGPWQGRTQRLAAGSTFEIGRGENLSISIPDPRMSRRHFLLVDTTEAFELVDLGSRNGTLVNQKRVKRVALKTGDHIEAGETLIEVLLLARR